MDDLTINQCVGVRDGCPMEYSVNGEGQIEMSLGRAHQSVELIFDPLALRQFMEMAGSALEQVALAIVQRKSETPQADEESAP